MEDYKDNSLKYWEDYYGQEKGSSLKSDDWLDRFEAILRQARGPVLDLGCGVGNNTATLLSMGMQVIACDQSPNALHQLKKNCPGVQETRCFNMLDGLPFEKESFEVILADLCLHYFREKDTEQILSEIRRILVPGGYLIFRVNSVKDVNHGAGQGTLLEHHLYETEGHTIKRFFDEQDIRHFFRDFEIEYLREEIMIRYKLEKQLFRVCVRKPG